MAMTKNEIIEKLTELGVKEFDPTAKKSELEDLLKEHSPEEEKEEEKKEEEKEEVEGKAFVCKSCGKEWDDREIDLEKSNICPFCNQASVEPKIE